MKRNLLNLTWQLNRERGILSHQPPVAGRGQPVNVNSQTSVTAKPQSASSRSGLADQSKESFHLFILNTLFCMFLDKDGSATEVSVERKQSLATQM